MDLYEIRGGRLGVIAEEAELQELSRESTAMETYNVGSPPSPTGAEDGSDGEEDAFKEGETEVRTLTNYLCSATVVSLHLITSLRECQHNAEE